MVVATPEIDQAVELLIGGGVVAFPTETVYGLGALASKPDAVERIFAMKGRPRHRALIVHIDRMAALSGYAHEIPEYALQLAGAFWPGPLTLVFRRKQTVIDQVTGGGDTVALRVPDHPIALQLLAALRHAAGETAGIAAPSANRFGEPPATSAQEVKDGLGSPGQCESAPDLILDAGECPRRVPSTIVSCVGAVPRLLRRGALSLEEIERVIGRHIDQ